GTAEHGSPFFRIGPDGVDNDYAVIQHFDYAFGAIQLQGTPGDYELRRYDESADGVATSGYYLFYTGDAGMAQPDLIAFVFNFDDVAPPVSGNPFQNPGALGNGTGILDLNDPAQFIYAQPLPTQPALAGDVTQVGTDGKEIVEAVAVDAAGNTYLAGATDGTFTGGPDVDHRIFVTQTLFDGTAGWTTELPMAEGTTLKAAITDDEFVYVAGRTLGALPGFTNAGRWDGIILKLRLDTGEIVATDQWGNAGIDGYGNLELDDAGNLFVSGQGSPAGPATTDDLYLVAKHRTSDLGNVWRQLDATAQQGFAASAEAWGGLTFVQDDSAAPGEGRLVVGGWVISFGGANAFAAVYEDLNATTPTIAESIILSPGGTTAEWIMDSAVDEDGNIYFVGYTTGDLAGPNSHQGNGDAFVAKYDSNLANPTIRQLGTSGSDMFRYLELDDAGNLYATGYTYGDLGGAPNADNTGRTGDVVVVKFDQNLNTLDATQFGTAGEDRAISTLFGDQLILGGMTEASLAGPSVGSFDGYVARLDTATLDVVATAPQLLSIATDLETRQAVAITFDTDIADSLSRGDISLRNLTTGQLIDDAVGTLSVAPDGRRFTLDFTNELPNGNYRLRIEAGSLTSPAGTPLASPVVATFTILAGDANGDRVVNLTDFLILRANFNQSDSVFSQGDFNFDGSVDLSDFLILRANFNVDLDDDD
ncbi:MAG: dockerin type I domain-containing protein, partial [Planctomycetota bacterium]